jgi:hypothetical protein
LHDYFDFKVQKIQHYQRTTNAALRAWERLQRDTGTLLYLPKWAADRLKQEKIGPS